MTDLPPFLYRTYRQNLHRTTTVKEYRQMHKLERIMYFWPMFWYVRLKGRRLKPEQTITAPKGAFFMPENKKEDSWPLT